MIRNNNFFRVFFVALCVMVLVPKAIAQNQKPVISDPRVEVADRTDTSIKLILPEATDDNTTWDKLEYTVMWLNADDPDAEMQWRTQKGIKTFKIYGLEPGATYYYYPSVRDEAGLVAHYDPFALKTPAKRYGIKVKGIEVDADNCNDVLKDGGKVSYDPEQGVLRFADANIEYDGVAVSTDVPVEIAYYGANEIISTTGIALWASKDVVIHQQKYAMEGNITFEGKTFGARCEGNLTVKQGDVRMISKGDVAVYMHNTQLRIAGCDFSVRVSKSGSDPVYNCGSYVGVGCTLSSFTGSGYVDLTYDSRTKRFVDAKGLVYNNMRSDMLDFESYQVYFGGEVVTSHNYFDVANDGGSVYYDNATHTFTLNNAKLKVDLLTPVGENIFTDMIDKDGIDFTFNLVGDNKLTCDGKGFYAPKRKIIFTGTGSLNVETAGIALQAGSDVVVEGGCNVTLNSQSDVFDARGLHVNNSTLILQQGNMYPAMAVVDNCQSFGMTNAHFGSKYHYYDAERFGIVGVNGEFARGEVRIIAGNEPEPKNKFDVNQDGFVNSADVVSIYNFIVDGAGSGLTQDRADVNGDAAVNAADVVAVYNYIIEGN